MAADAGGRLDAAIAEALASPDRPIAAAHGHFLMPDGDG